MTTAMDWTGKVGGTWASEWRRTDLSFSDLSHHLDAAILSAAPDSGKAVDLGCGAGETSLALAAARPGIDVLGVDVSADLVAAATARAAASPGPPRRFAVADLSTDAATLAADADLLVSRHGVMFFADPAAVFAALHAAAKPGAALVFSCFRAPSDNPWAGSLVAAMGAPLPQRPAGYAPGPFGFADRDWVAAMLASAGWCDVDATPIDFRYIAGRGADPVADALHFFRRIGPVAAALNEAEEADREGMLDKLAATLQDARDGEMVAFPAAAWIWRARA